MRAFSTSNGIITKGAIKKFDKKNLSTTSRLDQDCFFKKIMKNENRNW